MRDLQMDAADLILGGNGVLIAAPTASGKTEALLAPILTSIAQRTGPGPHALWLCPTRALVNDLAERLRPICRRLDLDVAVRTGDHKSRLSGRTAVVLTTPESLDVIVSSRALSRRYSNISFIMIDEVHLLFGTRRGLQVLMLLERLSAEADARFLRSGLSATVSDPNAVARWLQGGGQPIPVVRGAHERDINMHLLGAYRDAQTAMVQTVEAGIRRGWKKMLVFCNTRNEADKLIQTFRGELPQLNSHLHFASLTKEQRERVEEKFKAQSVALCVATSTLELGVDIGDIDATFMFGAPGSISSFMQRAGRGNRRSNTVEVVAMARTHDLRGDEQAAVWERDVLAFAGVLRAIDEGIVEGTHIPEHYSVGVQQAFSIARRYEKTGAIPLRKAAGEAAPWLDEGVISRLLDHLATLGYLEYQAYGDYYSLSDRGWELTESPSTWSNFEGRSEGMPVRYAGDLLEQVAWTNHSLLAPGALVRIAGKTWEVKDRTAQGISVREPTRSGEPIRPQRAGGAWHFSYELAQMIKHLPSSIATYLEDVEPRLQPWYETWAKRFSDIDPREHLAFEARERDRLLTFLGGIGNRVLAERIRSSGFEAKAGEFAVDSSRQALSATELTDVAGTIGQQAAALERHVAATAHFGMLDPELQRREVESIIADPRILSDIAELSNLQPRLISPSPPRPRGA